MTCFLIILGSAAIAFGLIVWTVFVHSAEISREEEENERRRAKKRETLP